MEIFNRLLELGADPKEADVIFATAGGSVEILKRVLELGADPKEADEARALCISCLLMLQLSDCDWRACLGCCWYVAMKGSDHVRYRLLSLTILSILAASYSPPLSLSGGANNSWPSGLVLDCLLLRTQRWSRMEIRR